MKNYCFALILTVMIFITGCTAALIGGAAGGGYAAATDERQTGRMIDDSTITTRINNALIKDDLVKAHQVDVDTIEGHVILTGVVSTKKQARRAVDLATNETGVKSVRNNLQIGKKSWGETFNDNWLVSRIKSKLIAEPEIRSLNIDVDAHRGVVTLTGIVGDAHQKKRAIEIARATDGTRRVVDNLKVK